MEENSVIETIIMAVMIPMIKEKVAQVLCSETDEDNRIHDAVCAGFALGLEFQRSLIGAFQTKFWELSDRGV
jgi:hypothetical protein